MNFDEIMQLPDSEKIIRLIGELDNENWEIRKKSHKLLIKIGEDVAPSLFKEIIEKNNDNITFWGLRVLSELKKSGMNCLFEIYKLNHDNREILGELIKNLKKFNDDRVIDILISELGNKNWSIRQEAANSLLHIGKIAVPKLKEAFNHGNKDVRYWTVKIIGQILGENAISPFVKLLNSDSNDLRYYAVTALGEIDSEKTIQPIIDSFSDKSWLVRNQAAEVLEKKGRVVVDYLVDAFTKGDIDKRYWSLRTITHIVKDEAIDLLKDFLSEDDTDLKFHFISSLQEIGNDKAIELLVKWLDDPTWLIRKSSANALINIGNKVIEPISKILNESKNENIRYWCVRILSELGDEGIKPLLDIVKTSKEKEKIFIIKAFQKSKSAIIPLINLLHDKSWNIRNSAYLSLKNVEPKLFILSVVENIDYESEEEFYWLRKILRENQSIYEDSIERYLESNEVEKKKLYKLLAFGATDIYVDLLIKVLREGNLTIREEVENSLHGFGDGDLMKLLLKKLENVSSEIAFWLYRIIISTKALTTDMVIKEISSASSDKLIWLSKIMGELKDDKFIPSLIGFLSSNNKNVRYEATKVLSKFKGDVLSQELLDYYLRESEEERISIIENFKTIANDEIVSNLIEKFESVNEKDGYWIAKLLAETSGSRIEEFKKIESNTSKTKKKYYWIKRIIEHLEGKSYL